MNCVRAIADHIEDILDMVQHGLIAGPVIKQYLTTEFDKFCKD